MSIIAWLAVIFSFLYIALAIKNKALCFVFGIISSSLWAYESYFAYHLKFDAGLQVFYVVMSIIGIYRWQLGGEENTNKAILKYSGSRHLLIISVGLLTTILFVFSSQYVPEIAKPKLDAFTTVFFIIGTLLLVERELYSWLYLVVCNIIMIYVYGVSSAWLFAIMMIFYTVFGTLGYLNWKKIIRKTL